MDTLPLVCSFENGHVLTLVPVPVDGTMDEVAAACAEHFAGRSLPLFPNLTMRVRKQGDTEFLPRDLRVRDAGWVPLTTIQVVYETSGNATKH
jgi:toluene monooxygenase system protein B